MIWRFLILTALATPVDTQITCEGVQQLAYVSPPSAIASNPPTKLKLATKPMATRYFDIDSDKGVAYLGPRMVDTCRVTVKEGRLYDDKGELLQRGPDTIFVIDPEGALLAYNPRSLGTLLIQHSSFTAGKRVACAGRMEVVDGIIQWADAKSGHYHPEKELFLQLRERLAELGYDLPLDNMYMHHRGTPALSQDPMKN